MTKSLRRLIRKTTDSLLQPYLREIFARLNDLNQQNQALLNLQYRQLAERNLALPFSAVGFRSHSQFEEDGILHYIFAIVGTVNKRAIEVCSGNGIECMAANLVVNHGWQALMFDGSAENIRAGNDYYRRGLSTWLKPPKFIQAWITAENINQLIADNGYTGEIDLLSLDIDGVDYHVLKALTVVNPRVMVLEFNPLWGPDDAVTVPYRPDFMIPAGMPGYSGMSLAAATKLAHEKGYRLVGTNHWGFNAFFVRNDISTPLLPERTPRDCRPDASSTTPNPARALEWLRV